MMRDGLSKREAEVIAFLRGYASKHPGQAPSYEELREALGLVSRSNVHRLVGQLVRKGWVQKGQPAARRALRVIEEMSPFIGRNIHGKATVLILAPSKTEARAALGLNASALAVEAVNLALAEPIVHKL